MWDRYFDQNEHFLLSLLPRIFHPQLSGPHLGESPNICNYLETGEAKIDFTRKL